MNLFPNFQKQMRAVTINCESTWPGLTVLCRWTQAIGRVHVLMGCDVNLKRVANCIHYQWYKSDLSE